jgi:hypothetical protein
MREPRILTLFPGAANALMVLCLTHINEDNWVRKDGLNNSGKLSGQGAVCPLDSIKSR